MIKTRELIRGFLCVIVLETHTYAQSLYAAKLIMKYCMSIKYGRVHYLHLLIQPVCHPGWDILWKNTAKTYGDSYRDAEFAKKVAVIKPYIPWRE